MSSEEADPSVYAWVTQGFEAQDLADPECEDHGQPSPGRFVKLIIELSSSSLVPYRKVLTQDQEGNDSTAMTKEYKVVRGHRDQPAAVGPSSQPLLGASHRLR